MRRGILLAGVFGLMCGSAAAQKKDQPKILYADKVQADADKKWVVSTVKTFIDGFNKGDTKTALATCASPAAIIDEFPPYNWQGPKACADWAAAYDAAAKQGGMTDGHVTMRPKPLFVEVTGDRGYVIMPVSFSYKQKGKPVNEGPARLTVALQKQGGAWKITAWTWSNH